MYSNKAVDIELGTFPTIKASTWGEWNADVDIGNQTAGWAANFTWVSGNKTGLKVGKDSGFAREVKSWTSQTANGTTVNTLSLTAADDLTIAELFDVANSLFSSSVSSNLFYWPAASITKSNTQVKGAAIKPNSTTSAVASAVAKTNTTNATTTTGASVLMGAATAVAMATVVGLF